jgi:dTDP-4-amino-4,6-dideoxygalactose transaminase
LSDWKIPFFQLEMGNEEREAALRVMESGWLTMGEVTRRFELEFADFLNVPYAFALSSCTAALHLANVALGVREGDEVICPAFTFVATINSILYCGGKVVFADITGGDELNISAAEISRRITPRTKGIVVVHYGGYPCRMREILEIAEQNNLFIIEDAAHAPGASVPADDGGGEAKVGTLGDVGCFSFFSNKNMTTGEGGMLVTGRPELAEKIAHLRSHGMTALTLDRYRGHAFSYDVTTLGYNYRLDEVRSAIGIAQLRKLQRHNSARERLAGYYRQGLADVPWISVPFERFAGKSAYHLFPILLDREIKRDAFMNYLKSEGIQTSIHYPAVHLFTYFRRRYGFAEGQLPKTEDVARRIVSLPLYPSLSPEQVDYVVSRVKKFRKKVMI